MELPQQRPFGTGGRKPTHDFLSLYGSHSTVQQDPTPPSQGGFLKTHDFLQPLERVENTSAKEETNIEISPLEKPRTPAPPQSVEHILPGGIGTYSINQISCFNHQGVPRPEGNVFTVADQAGGFSLWGEGDSAVMKGKTRKENVGEPSNTGREAASKAAGQWTTSERQSPSSSNNLCNSFSSFSSSQPSGQKNQNFNDMIKLTKGSSTHDEDLEDEEEFVLKKESTSPIRNGELRVKVEEKSSDQKANTPRSKHSATEQRRRSKINDRFQMLRELLPQGDQKRDKASFLLEVVEYIQFLQEKVQKFEGSYPGWNQEPPKLAPQKNHNWQAESYVNQSPALNGGPNPALLFASTLDDKNITISPAIPGTVSNPVESDMSSATNFKTLDHHPGMSNKTIPFSVSRTPNFFDPAVAGSAVAQLSSRLASDADNVTTQSQPQPQPQSYHTRSCSIDGAAPNSKLKEQELTIEGGTISISSVYSQGLLNTLTRALQNSGVDLSQASISVQIELAKRSNRRTAAQTSYKDNEVPSSNQGTTRSRVSMGEESHKATKKLRTSKN